MRTPSSRLEEDGVKVPVLTEQPLRQGSLSCLCVPDLAGHAGLDETANSRALRTGRNCDAY